MEIHLCMKVSCGDTVDIVAMMSDHSDVKSDLEVD